MSVLPPNTGAFPGKLFTSSFLVSDLVIRDFAQHQPTQQSLQKLWQLRYSQERRTDSSCGVVTFPDITDFMWHVNQLRLQCSSAGAGGACRWWGQKTVSLHRRHGSDGQRRKSLLRLFAGHLVNLGGTVHVGDCCGQLEVLPAVCPTVTCPNRTDEWPQAQNLISNRLFSRFPSVLLRFMERFQNFKLFSGVDGFHYLTLLSPLLLSGRTPGVH